MAERISGRSTVTIPGQSVYEGSADQIHELGTRLVIGERVYRYALMGATAGAAGKVYSGAQAIINEQTVTVAHGIGTYDVDVTAASVTAGQFAGGMLYVTAGTAIGEAYKIRDNDATGGAAGTGLVRFTLYDPLATAWSTTDTDVSVLESSYYKVVLSPTDGFDRPSGVCPTIITAAEYCWLQTWGPCGVIVDTGTAAGAEIDEAQYVVSSNHAGQVIAVASGASDAYAHIGYQMVFADHTDNEAMPMWLTIAP